MSKRVPARITCPACEAHFNVELYRTLWVEYPENRRLVADNQLNLVTCPNCHASTRLEYPVLCTNVHREIAIWYEPYPDPAVDDDLRQYALHFGPNSFYAQAPRVPDWDDFKAKLTEMEALSHKDKQRPLPTPSPEMTTSRDAPVKSLPKRRPSWISHLRNPALRLLYAALPMTALILFAAWESRTYLDDWLHHRGSYIALVFLIGTGSLFGLLSAIKAVADNLPSVLPKAARVHLFLAICWAVMSFFVLLLFDPLGHRSLYRMDGREIAQEIFIVIGLPLLSGFAHYSFNRFIK